MNLTDSLKALNHVQQKIFTDQVRLTLKKEIHL